MNVFERACLLVPLESYLASEHGFGLGPTPRNSSVASACPFHADEKRSLVISASGSKPWSCWRCYGACDDQGSVIEAAKRGQRLEAIVEATVWLDEHYALGLGLAGPGRKNDQRLRRLSPLASSQSEIIRPA